MSDIYERTAERMAMAITADYDAYAIMAKKRVRAVQASDMPTIDDYRTALIRCVADKASDWKAACESAEAASKQSGQLQSEIARLRLTDAEREAVRVARDAYADDEGSAECEEIAAVLSGLLERTK